MCLRRGRRIDAGRQATEQQGESEVRNSMQAVISARGALASAREMRRLAGEQHESEQRQFRAGLSTVFLVLQRQNELITARGRALRAEIDLANAVAEFERVAGRTLQAHGIQAGKVP